MPILVLLTSMPNGIEFLQGKPSLPDAPFLPSRWPGGQAGRQGKESAGEDDGEDMR